MIPYLCVGFIVLCLIALGVMMSKAPWGYYDSTGYHDGVPKKGDER